MRDERCVCDHIDPDDLDDLDDLARVDKCGAPATHLISSPEWRDEYGSCDEHLAAWAACGTRHEYGVGTPVDVVPVGAPGAGARRVIVSRHPAAVEFIRGTDLRFAGAPVIASATADDVRGAHVAGNIPLHLAVLAASVTSINFDGPAPRGAEYTLADMAAAQAWLGTYVVCDAATYRAFGEYVRAQGAQKART